MLRASLSSYPSCCCCSSSSSSYLSYNEPEPTISSSQKKKMAQPRNPNAPQQEQHNHQQNSTFLLDALYCEEEHSLDQESEEEEQSHYSNHNNNEDPSKKSNPDLPFLVEHDLIWEEEELRFLLSKEEEGNHVNVFGGIERNPSLVRARREGLEWMMKVSALYDFSAATPILAVNCLDRFFVSFFSSNRRQEKPWMTQLTAVACLSLAAKVEEIHVPLLLDLQVGDAKYVFEAKTIQRMEILVLSTLQWKMNPATPLSFVDYIVRRIGLKSEDRLICWEFLRRCERLLLSLVCDSRFMCFLPSVMAIAMALQVLDGLVEPCVAVEYQNQVLGFPGINKDKVGECCELIKGSQWQWKSQSNKRKLRSSSVVPPRSPSGVMDAYFSCDSSRDSVAAASSVSSSSSSSPEPLWKKNRGMRNFPRASPEFLGIPPP